MFRIDIRVNGLWEAEVKTGKGAYQAVLSNISLGGAFLKGEFPKTEEFFILKWRKEERKFEFKVKTVRKDEEGIGVLFLFQNGSDISRVWAFIREELREKVFSTCPYCGKEMESSLLRRCPHCKFLLSFQDKSYLNLHLRETLSERLRIYSEGVKEEEFFVDFLPYVQSVFFEPLKDQEPFEELIGSSEKMLEVFSLIRKVAPVDVPVLIQGETGTGKELVARAIHRRSPRSKKNFVVINCAAIPESLLEAELFGYERGAFTGAYSSRKGKLEEAHGGTLFLDEIGEMPLALQAKLLRFIEDKAVERIGSRNSKTVDCRIIAATNRDLEKEMREGRFREDLYYRLSVVTINLPPLRERDKDKVLLAQYFLEKLQKEKRDHKKRLSPEALQAIMEYHWPGNVREMINKIRKALLVGESELITPEDLSLNSHPPKTLKNSLKEENLKLQKEALLSALKISEYNISRTAKLLGVSRPTVYSLMKRFGLSFSASSES
jgi:transcriptional regulator with PAS, ATPase and Fis domain